MVQSIFNHSIPNHGLLSRLSRNLRRVILKFGDPLVSYDLNGVSIRLNLSHELPYYREEHPTYCANLSRLTAFVRQRFGGLRMIDVGANIGDSYCLAGEVAGDEFLLIEGDSRYFKLLEMNTAKARAVTSLLTFVSDKAGASTDKLVSGLGTGHITSTGEEGDSIVYSTIDGLIKDHPSFARTNILKTDVDGFDCRVLRGADDLIKSASPVLFFEHSPFMLSKAHEDDRDIFKRLGEWGYGKLIFYDNRGFLAGCFDTADSTLIDDLMSYALQQKDAYYYDICCFSDRHATLRDEFVDLEREYFRGRAN